MLLLTVLAILGVLAMLYLFFRWIYRTWLSDDAADKAELRALAEHFEQVKDN